MKLVIDVPDGCVRVVMANQRAAGTAIDNLLRQAVIDGTPLPKWHEWIPVSERLPEEKIAVLVWCPERKNIYCACYEEKEWWIFGAYFEKVTLEVIAWVPLPEPYKAESEDRDENNN